MRLCTGTTCRVQGRRYNGIATGATKVQVAGQEEAEVLAGASTHGQGFFRAHHRMRHGIDTRHPRAARPMSPQSTCEKGVQHDER